MSYRAHVWAQRSPHGHLVWYYNIIRQSDRAVVASDNCTNYQRTQRSARMDVYVFWRMSNLGYEVKSWGELLREAS